MIEVITTGIYSSIQDQGRFGFRNIGVPVSGVMDSFSANLANALLNNHKQCAVLETTFVGPVLRFHQETFIAITGADCLPKINDKPICLNSAHKILKGDILNMGSTITGIRNYLTVAEGFQSEFVLNSRSYYAGITENQTLIKGEFIKTPKLNRPIINRTKTTPRNTCSKQQSIEVKKGPEFNLLDKKSQKLLFREKFKISSQSNRMAYQLEPEPHGFLETQEIITSSVQPGTVQLMPSGKPIVLMRDCQTTGGYSRVLQLTEKAINQISQKRPNDFVFFTLN
ncbi:MAG: biotin-dependent carboxyltransferase family protein [Proteobacteria bacterium]|nr:biotin-dependent carboxyltransferase family protein [Pseudomonadota bacterium]